MITVDQIREIYKSGLLGIRDPRILNVNTIRHMDNGERTGYFGSFRYKLDKSNALLLTINIRLDMVGKNVQIRMFHISGYGYGFPSYSLAKTKALFKTGLECKFQSLLDIVEGDATEVLAEKLNKAIRIYHENKSF